jgi:hypothetical protein
MTIHESVTNSVTRALDRGVYDSIYDCTRDTTASYIWSAGWFNIGQEVLNVVYDDILGNIGKFIRKIDIIEE